ncbi:hypothetical protein FIU11_01845 [Vibrio furnissii]|nr:hypothetical protein FIU11_01845 [Vibrio furnissii]
MLSAHHASNGRGKKQGDSSKITHAFPVVLGDPSHIVAWVFYRARKPLRQIKRIIIPKKLSTSYGECNY